MHRYWVHVDAGHCLPKAVEDFTRFQLCFSGGIDEVGYRFGHEGPGATGRVKNSLIQRVVHELSHHGADQPGGSVVLSQLPPFLRWYHSLVQDCSSIWWGLCPVEASYPAG